MTFGVRPMLIGILLCSGINAWAQLRDDLEVVLTPAAREYCHIIQFPQAWAMPSTDEKTGLRLFFGSGFSRYEFRVEGSQGTRFLVAGITEYFPPAPYYTTNQFRVDLSDPTAPIEAASREAWDAAPTVPFTKEDTLRGSNTPSEDKPLEFNGFQFVKSGEFWDLAAARVSPDRARLVLLSEDHSSVSGTTSVFFDAFNADTGKKLFTVEGAFSSPVGDEPVGPLDTAGWVTEYFIVPLGKQIERCMVCEFGARHDVVPQK